MVLFGALLAPAILAGGLLVGEVRGFEQGVDGGAVAGAGVMGLVLEPVLVPAPDRPDRRYRAVVPSPVRVAAAPERAPKREVEEAAPKVVKEEPVTPTPVQTQAGCPGEWADTWLWELCQDREQEAAAEGYLGAGDGGWCCGDEPSARVGRSGL
ncbi:hypothetical protein FAF44_24115 [Nonomuraea sp. MG754425]|uniref:hypothetical protein n=1 Tax=Nonomuraea sp. MG754425 TaxID=2570319 RepID=UPI001F4384C2|nr:hypothetical protein [Nonomuraea sp. MG754425]MCF6471454.1 hypothetical protein [Nonomuraea sp. MG754425]